MDSLRFATTWVEATNCCAGLAKTDEKIWKRRFDIRRHRALVMYPCIVRGVRRFGMWRGSVGPEEIEE